MQIKQNPPTEVGVIVGRFQVDALHAAHIELIEFVKSRHTKVIVLLGCTTFVGDEHDPLDFDARRLMIQEKYPDLIILPIMNQREDTEWSKLVDSTIRTVLTPGQTPTLYGSRDSFIPYYSGKYSTIEVEHPSSVMNVSGSSVRARLANSVQASQGFRAGMIHQACARWPEVRSTVDVAIIDFEKERILLGRKPGETKYRFIGGFADKRDANDESTAAREVAEETGLDCSADAMYYIGSANIDDWRLRNRRNSIRTRMFVSPYTFGNPKPDDDIEELRWFPYADVVEGILVEEHHPLLTLLQNALFQPYRSKYYPIIQNLKPKKSQ